MCFINQEVYTIRKPSVQLSHSVMSDSLRPHGLQHTRPPGPPPAPGVYSNSCPLSRWWHIYISLHLNISLQKLFSPDFSTLPSNGSNLIVSLSVLVTQSCPTLCDSMDCTARQALLSMGFSRQGYWSGLPFPSPGDIPSPGIKLGSPALQADALLSELLVSMSHENVSSNILCDLIARKKKDNNLFPELFKAYSDWRMSFLFSSSCLSCYIGILCLK